VHISGERGSVCFTVWVRWARRCVWVEWLPKNAGSSVWECVVVICVYLLILHTYLLRSLNNVLGLNLCRVVFVIDVI
jgi:hypothetical protein